MYGSLCTPSFYVTWCHFRSIRVSVLFECLCRLVSRPFCTGLYVRVSISLGHTSILYRSLCCPRFYVTLSHFVLYVSLCCPSFYVTSSHPRYVLLLVLSDLVALCRRYNCFRKISSE